MLLALAVPRYRNPVSMRRNHEYWLICRRLAQCTFVPDRQKTDNRPATILTRGLLATSRQNSMPTTNFCIDLYNFLYNDRVYVYFTTVHFPPLPSPSHPPLTPASVSVMDHKIGLISKKNLRPYFDYAAGSAEVFVGVMQSWI